MVWWDAEGASGVRMSVVELETSAERVVDTGTRQLGPGGSWSPDDRLFAAIGRPGADSPHPSVGILDVATGTWKPVEVGEETDTRGTYLPRWTPGGEALLFDAYVMSDGSEDTVVYLYDLAGEECSPVAQGSVRGSDSPFWGDSFVFLRKTDERDTRGALRRRFFMRALQPTGDGASAERELLPDKVVDRVVVSPQGTHAVALCLPPEASVSDRGHAGHVMYILTQPGSPRARLLSQVLLRSLPGVRWAAGGDRIVGYLWEPHGGGSPRLCIVDTASGNVIDLWDRSGHPIRGQDAHWVDGDRGLAYWRRGDSGRGEIWCYVLATNQNYRLLPPVPLASPEPE